jgi:hypothetical protein
MCVWYVCVVCVCGMCVWYVCVVCVCGMCVCILQAHLVSMGSSKHLNVTDQIDAKDNPTSEK